jgi:hypothetical protein
VWGLVPEEGTIHQGPLWDEPLPLGGAIGG